MSCAVFSCILIGLGVGCHLSYLSAFMGTINVSDLQTDMELASDVKNMNDHLLFPVGTRINEKHLRTLKAWGIIEVDVVGISREDVSQRAIAALDPEILAAAEAHVAPLFRYTDRRHSLISELFRLCVLRKAHPSFHEKNQ